MRFRSHDRLHKTLAFTAIHLAIALTLGALITGSFVLAGVLSLVEPALNAAAHYRLDRAWGGRGLLGKTLVFGATHLIIATAVGFALTGSWVMAGMYALLEPAVNTVAHYGFERWWSSRRTPTAGARAQAA